MAAPIFGYQSDPRSHRLAGTSATRDRAIDPHFAFDQGVDAERCTQDCRATGTDQPRYADNLPGADGQIDGLHPSGGESPQFEDGLAFNRRRLVGRHFARQFPPRDQFVQPRFRIILDRTGGHDLSVAQDGHAIGDLTNFAHAVGDVDDRLARRLQPPNDGEQAVLLYGRQT